MARTHECEHQEQYIICKVCDDEGEALSPARLSTPFAAKFYGDCPLCSEPINIGDSIVLVDTPGDEKIWPHYDCARDEYLSV